MSSWQLEKQYKELHLMEYNEELKTNWSTVKVTDEEIIKLEKNEQSYYELFNDGREIY